MAEAAHLFYAACTMATPGALLIALAAGTVGGLFAGLTPGVSGRVGLVLVTPLAVMMGPVAGAVFLVAFHSVIHTSGSIPAILIGAPTSAPEAATVIDGYPMTRKGEGSRAIGAALAASAVGGVIGAFVLLTLAPVALTATRYIGGPESAALSLLGLLSISALSGNGMAGGLAGGLLSAALGVIVASIGLDDFSVTGRFTFGFSELSDGINVATIVTGLFVVPELLVRRTHDSDPPVARLGSAPVLEGFFETLRYRWLLLRTSLLGAAVGLIPGLGASVAVWLAYGHARQTEPSAVPYGEGAIQGVIAPEAANNSKEGGSLAPTLFFGIPGSSGMAILLAAFLVVGVEIGPRMMMNQPEFVYLMGLTNILSNLIAVPICLMILPTMARLATIRPVIVAPVALAAAICATWMTEPLIFTIVSILIFSAVGLVLKLADLPRAPLLLGFVLAPAIEQGMVRASMLHGMSAFSRPGVLVIIGIALMIVVPAAIRHFSRGPDTTPPAPPLPMLAPALALSGAIMLAGLFGLPGNPMMARIMPGIAGAIGLGGTLVCAWNLWKAGRARGVGGRPDGVLLGLGVAMLAAIPLVGAPIAAAAFVIAGLTLTAHVHPRWAVATGIPLGLVILLLTTLER